jgi:hypothetical protein
MTRSGSTGDTKYQHLRRNGDHKIVVIPKHKGDRSGKKPTDKAMYSNPTCPEHYSIVERNFNDFDSVLLGTKTDENINLWL